MEKTHRYLLSMIDVDGFKRDRLIRKKKDLFEWLYRIIDADIANNGKITIIKYSIWDYAVDSCIMNFNTN